MDLTQVLNDAVVKLAASGKIEEQIELSLEKMVRGIVADELREYSDFGKVVREKVRESLAIRGDIDLPSYNDSILRVVRKVVEHATKDAIQNQVAETLEDFLTPAPETIKFSKLCEQFLESVKQKQRGGCVCYGEAQGITVDLALDSTLEGYRTIYLSGELNRTRSECDMQIGTRRDGGVYFLRFRDRTIENVLFTSPLYGFQRSIFQMKAAGTRIEFDVDPVDVETTFDLEESY